MASLTFVWARRDLRARYRHSWLRASWSILLPATLLLTYGWVFSGLGATTDSGVDYLSFAWAGLVLYSFAAQTLSAGVGSLIDSRHVISKIYFPREVVPLSVVAANLVDLMLNMVVLAAITMVRGIRPSIHWLAIAPILTGQVLIVAGATVLVAALTVVARDLRHAMPLIVRVLFIVSPIMYAPSAIGELAVSISRFNPLAIGIESLRDATLYNRWPPIEDLATCTGVGAAILVVAFTVLQRVDPVLVDNI